MIDIIFQFPFSPELIAVIVTPIGVLILELILVKIGLAISKAETRKNFKWTLGSILIQIGLIAFISLPVLLEGFSTGWSEGGPNAVTIISLSIVGAIIDVNLINVIHEIGIGKSIFVFILFAIPMVFLGYILGTRLPVLF
ncbi:MAG: hypothetical protein GF317_22950 [Candidatus Lokiarchaeota archaeon]|nr:hypothetical protein [Candidatus Lokiarchaeota archaeon]MBD3202305.1 hypothetical protein [Candidatus Lokiarchaeota archaeon]